MGARIDPDARAFSGWHELQELTGELHVDAMGVSAQDAPHGKWGAAPHPDSPRSVHECHRSKNVVLTWRKSQPDDVRVQPHRCRNWRHAGPCARWRASQDYSRMKQAFSERDRGDMLYLVLTLDPSAWTGAGWEGPARERVAGAVTDKHAIQAAYKHLVQCWTAFRRMLRDRYSKLVQKNPRKWERPVIEYVCTVEAHRSGWPHLNVVLVAPDIAREAKAIEDGEDLKSYSRKAKGREVARRMFSRELRDSGFGKIAFVEPALPTSDDGGDRLAAYLLKLSGSDGVAWDGEAKGGLVDSLEGRQVAEIAKLSQVPYVAPKNFRRLRSSPKFLPPAHKGDGEWTGGIYNRETGQALRANRFAGMPELAAKAKEVGGKAERSIREYISHAMDRYRDVVGDMKPSERADLKLAISIINGEGRLPNKKRRVDYPVSTETCDLVTSLEKLKAWIGEPGPGLDRTARVYKLKRFRE